MFYVVSWIVVIALLSLWSLAAWALYAVAAWAISNAGALTGAASDFGAIAIPDWLASWLPPEIALWAVKLAAGLAPWVDGLLQTAPTLAGGLTLVAWIVWGIGSLMLMFLGAGVHLLIALWLRGGSGRSDRSSSASLPAG